MKIFRRFLRIVYNDDLWSVIGLILSVLTACKHYYFSGHTDKAIFWMVFAILCLVNLKNR